MARIAPIAVAALLGLAALRAASSDTQNGQWRRYSADNGSTKFSALDQINRSNVAQLKVAWRRPQAPPDIVAANPGLRLNNNYRATPIMVDGVLYASNGLGLAEAINPQTGATIWVQKPGDDPLRGSASARGVAYWTDNGRNDRIFTYRNQFLYALDPKTGDLIPSFGTGGRIDLSLGLSPLAGGWNWNAAPLVIRDVVVLGSAMVNQDSASKMEGAPGVVRAFDARSGKLRWTWSPIPRAGEAGVETWENESWSYTGAGNVWSLMSADDELGYVYLPTTSVTNDMYGGHRLGDNLYSSSVVCLDAATGKRLWHFQTVHHDLFDYDNPAAPILADITVNGQRIRAVVQVTKQSFAYVLDRVTGKPVWPIEERPAPASTVPGEKAAATQPTPTKPPAFDRQGITENDLIDFTPELRAQAKEMLKQYVTGPIFTPPSIAGPGADDKKGTIQLPGSVGGADWTGAAFDPETGMLFVPSMTNPFVANLLPGDAGKTNLRYRASTRELFQGPQGLPLMKPPYGRVTALDLNRGDLAWTVPNGDGPRNHPAIAHLKLGPLGNPVRSAVIVTRSLVFATVGDQITVRTPPNGGGRQFSALDKATGALVWKTELDAGATGAPMTYMHQGKQYIVFAIGGQQHPAEFVALALP
jgi:quinoprotein glucose dehydrogenase